MHGRPIVVAALLLSGVATPASAADDFARIGPYVAVGGTFAHYTQVDDEVEDELFALGYIVDVDIDDPLGLNAQAGYRAHSNFAVEAEFEWLADAEIEVAGIGTGIDLQSYVFTANAKGYILTGRIQPHLLVGVGAMASELDAAGISEDESGFAARFGGGIDIYLSPNFYLDLGIDYVLPTGDVENLDFLSFGWGFGYRF